MPPKRKFGGSSAASGAKAEPWGNWQISDNRQLSISLFTGSPKIDLRETYTKNGEQLPGKKGISLSIEQWKAVLKAAPEVEKILKEKGEWETEEGDGEASKSKKSKKSKDEITESDDEEAEKVAKKKDTKKDTKKKTKKSKPVESEDEEDED